MASKLSLPRHIAREKSVGPVHHSGAVRRRISRHQHTHRQTHTDTAGAHVPTASRATTASISRSHPSPRALTTQPPPTHRERAAHGRFNHQPRFDTSFRPCAAPPPPRRILQCSKSCFGGCTLQQKPPSDRLTDILGRRQVKSTCTLYICRAQPTSQTRP